MTRFSRCFRCGDKSYEQLSSHGHCVSCFYSRDADESVPGHISTFGIQIPTL